MPVEKLQQHATHIFFNINLVSLQFLFSTLISLVLLQTVTNTMKFTEIFLSLDATPKDQHSSILIPLSHFVRKHISLAT